MDELPSAEKRRLRARAHALNPVVLIGNNGLTPSVVTEIDRSLKAHELINIVPRDRAQSGATARRGIDSARRSGAGA